MNKLSKKSPQEKTIVIIRYHCLKKKNQKENKIKSNIISSPLFGNRHNNGDDDASSLSPSHECLKCPLGMKNLLPPFCELKKLQNSRIIKKNK